VLTRVQAGEGHGLTGVIEAARLGIEGQQDGDGALAQAGDGVEQVLYVAQTGVAIDVRPDRLG